MEDYIIVKKGKNCKVFCSVPGCNSKGMRDRTLSFHLFPREGQKKVKFIIKGYEEMVDRRLAWILRTKIRKQISPFMKVCSKHFLSSDFFYGGKNKLKRMLLKTAVPSVNLPKRKFEKITPRRNRVIQKNDSVEKSCISENQEVNSTINCPGNKEIEASHALLQLACSDLTVQFF